MKAEGEDEEDGMAEATRDGSAAGAASRPIEVAVLDDYQGVARELAAWDTLPAGSEVVVFREHLAEREELVQRLAPFEVIVAMRERTPFPRELLERLPALRLLVTTGRRNAAIDVVAAKERGVLVCGTDTLPYPTAELTIGLMIALARRIPEEDRALRAGRWQTSLGLGLSGKTLGLLGLGRLGEQVARVGRALDMRVIAWSQNLTAERAAQASAEWVSRETLFRESDVLSIHLVLSERSRALVGEAELGMMKSSAFLINTSRGPIVDEAALIAALERKTIAGAGLDVFDCEPLPAGHPLLRLDNTVLTPHLGYVTRETYDIFYQQALEDIFGYLRGAPLRELSG
jgi:phosphoglycerate dehydrogenase-like enzyme